MEARTQFVNDEDLSFSQSIDDRCAQGQPGHGACGFVGVSEPPTVGSVAEEEVTRDEVAQIRGLIRGVVRCVFLGVVSCIIGRSLLHFCE